MGGKLANVRFHYPWPDIVNDYVLLAAPNLATGKYPGWNEIKTYNKLLYRSEGGDNFREEPVLDRAYRDTMRAIRARETAVRRRPAKERENPELLPPKLRPLRSGSKPPRKPKPEFRLG